MSKYILAVILRSTGREEMSNNLKNVQFDSGYIPDLRQVPIDTMPITLVIIMGVYDPGYLGSFHRCHPGDKGHSLQMKLTHLDVRITQG